jgi:hypothetical protein
MPISRLRAIFFFVFVFQCALSAQTPRSQEPDITFVLKPALTFDGETLQQGWAVRIKGERIESAGPAASIDTAGAR